MIIVDVTHLMCCGPAIEEILRNPVTLAKKANPCLTNDFKNVNRQSAISVFSLAFLKERVPKGLDLPGPKVAWISRISSTALIFLVLFLSRKKEQKEKN